MRNVPVQGAMYAMLDIRSTGMDLARNSRTRCSTAELIATMPGESFGKAASGSYPRRHDDQRRRLRGMQSNGLWHSQKTKVAS